MASETRGPVKTFTASEDLAAWRRVKFTSGSRTAVQYADAEEPGIGVTETAVDSGENVGVRLFNDAGTFKFTCSEATDLGDRLYPAADGKVSDTPTNSGAAVAEALEAGSADGSVIEGLPLAGLPGASGSSLAHADVADGTSYENSITETTMATKTIKPADLSPGDVLEVIASVFVEDNNSTDTLTLKLYLGTEEIIATAAVDVADNDVGFVHAFITIRTLGASGTIAATGVQGLGVPGTVTAKPFRKAEATEDISADFEIALKGTWSVAHADNEAETENFIVIHHRQ